MVRTSGVPCTPSTHAGVVASTALPRCLALTARVRCYVVLTQQQRVHAQLLLTTTAACASATACSSVAVLLLLQLFLLLVHSVAVWAKWSNAMALHHLQELVQQHVVVMCRAQQHNVCMHSYCY